MAVGRGNRRLSFLDSRAPSAFRTRWVVILPGRRLPTSHGAWRDELVVVESGQLDVEGRGGVRRRFVAGDILCFDGLSLISVRNPGVAATVLSAVSRAAPQGPRGAEHVRLGHRSFPRR